jgi:A/G-specific adenine glycosylase
MDPAIFKKTIWSYYKKHKRDMSWREHITPYRIVVSEIMLQQTQADRVAKKFDSFIKKFPDFTSLASAELEEVLKEWQGLGYNRRALNLHRLAQETKGKISQTYSELLELPGIGPNTAGSILAFAFNIPHPFIETNIRTVFLHFFFKNARGKIHDKKLIPLIQETLDMKNPREWYYALMDYGAYLKKLYPNPSRKSKHHVQQSKFKGSNRELRSHILKEILKEPQTVKSLAKFFPDKDAGMIDKNVQDLQKEGFIVLKGKIYTITKS